METWDAIRSRRNVRAYGKEAIALIAPKPGDARSRDLVQYDLGQATMSIMVAAADLGIGSAHAASATRTLPGASLASPRTGSAPG